MAILSPAPKLQFFGSDGAPLVGGKLYSYAAGTTTLLATYADQSGVVENPNPIILNSRGEAGVWLGPSDYKLVLKTSTDVEIWSVDDIAGSDTGALTQLAAPNGSSLVGYIQGGTSSIATTVQTKLREQVSVKDFGAIGNGVADDSAAFAAAAAAAHRVYVPSGTYLVDASNSGPFLPSNTHFFGDGETSVIGRYSYSPAKACFLTDSGGPGTFITDIGFSNLKFRGRVDSLGHDEVYGHFIYLSGVKRVTIENCYFEGPRGDAIYIGSGPGGPLSERHNYEIVIRNNVFDGVINGVDGGRNAISVIDVNNILIDGNTFTTWSRNDMPGSIDFEPNYSFGVIKNVRVVNNRFTNCAGNRGHVTFSVDKTASANFQNAIVSNNSFEICRAAVCIYTSSTLPSVFPTAAQEILISNNTATRIGFFVEKVIGPIYDLTITDNIIFGTASGDGRIVIGDASVNWTVKDINIVNNTITSVTSTPIVVYDNCANVIIARNTMRGATSSHITIGATGTTSNYIMIMDNLFLGTPTYTVRHDASADFGAATNVYKNNYAPPTVSSLFRVYQTDNTGGTVNTFTTATTPDAFPFGISVTRISGEILPGSGTGMLMTYKMNATEVTSTYQLFVPLYAGHANDMYIRKASGATTWGAAYRFVGV